VQRRCDEVSDAKTIQNYRSRIDLLPNGPENGRYNRGDAEVKTLPPKKAN
jgi:hypothetical protein